MARIPLPVRRAGPGTCVVGLAGTGIGPSLSPSLHEREGQELGLDYRYHRLDLERLGVAPESIGELLAAARDAGYRGLNVTHPCKQLVLAHLDELAPDAAAIGAVNTVVFEGNRAVGHNTDWSGFARGLATGLPDARRDRVVLLGAGGAGAAAAHALLGGGTRRLTVLDLDPDRAERLAADLTGRFGADRAVAGAVGDDLPELLATADGLVHATPTGMREHPGLPVPVTLLRPPLWVAEVVYRPLDTALLLAARARGCPAVDGGRMAVHQAVEAFRLFTGVAPDPDRMLRHFGELVTATEEDADVRVG
jgi:shikimate dehydrogenase